MPASSRCALARHFAGSVHDGPQAEAQPMHGFQVPLDGTDGQPGLLPQRGNQAEQVDPQTLLACRHAVQSRFGDAAPLAPGTGAGQVGVFGHLCRNSGQVYYFPGPLGPTPRQLGAATGTLLHHVLHSMGGRHAGSGKAMTARLAGLLRLGRLPLLFGLQAGHSPRVLALALPFQSGNPLLQERVGRL